MHESEEASRPTMSDLEKPMTLDSISPPVLAVRDMRARRVVEIVDYFRQVCDVPGIRLSPADAALLSGVEESRCRAIMLAFVDASVLRRESADVFTARA